MPRRLLAALTVLALTACAGPIRNGTASFDTADARVQIQFQADVSVATFTPTPTPPPTATPTSTPTPTDAQRWGIPDGSEVRPGNASANSSRGRALDPALLNAGDPYQHDYLAKVDGNFIGTTEQILEWAARKWFPDQDRDLFKAQAVKESNWDQTAQGDLEQGAYQSFGLLQVKLKYWCSVAGCEQVKTSTAFGVDVAAAAMRAHYDGVLYTGDYATWNVYPIRPSVPDPIRMRRALNAWFFGDGANHSFADWSVTGDGAASEYVNLILGYLADKPWRRAGF